MLATTFLIANHGLFPILLCWLLGGGAIAGMCLYNRRRLRDHDTHR